MPPFRRPVMKLSTLILATTLAVLPTWANAQTYPNKPVRLVVTFPAGGAPDILARLFADKAQLGQPVVIDNVPGAGGNIGADKAAKAPADGYTLVMGTVGTHSINGALYSKMPYDMVKDFAPVGHVASAPNLLVVNNDLPVKTVAELIAYLKAHPNKLSFGSPGIGSSVHVSGELFKSLTGTTMQHVPYKGSGPLATDLLGGQISMSFDTVTPVLPHIKAGKLRALAVTTARRSGALPDVPTLEEAGLKGFDIGTWFGVLAPAATPKEVVARLNAEMVKIIKSPDFGKRMAEIGAEPIGNTSEQMAQQIKVETEKFARLVKEAKVVIE
ncbi:MAG: MFS transporter [Burkholderiales bacterium PBB5]|nr:MAG: MFS transporter [Burkholderiales bacterium PBB5]